MPIDGVFTITGRGTVVTGTVAVGCIKVGEQVFVDRRTGSSKAYKVIAIEKFRNNIDEAKVGDAVGIMLQNLTKEDATEGDIVGKNVKQ